MAVPLFGSIELDWKKVCLNLDRLDVTGNKGLTAIRKSAYLEKNPPAVYLGGLGKEFSAYPRIDPHMGCAPGGNVLTLSDYGISGSLVLTQKELSGTCPGSSPDR